LSLPEAQYNSDFIVRVIEGTIVHAVLHAGSALKDETQFVDDLTRVATRYLEISSAPCPGPGEKRVRGLKTSATRSRGRRS
jgi:hypothetical protein